ncbi:hypothetical protein TNCV_2391321 [Trichonephila clavipes]|nr:hypothetical protein TNCV_2391321 [Trichonephila clavipes]
MYQEEKNINHGINNHASYITLPFKSIYAPLFGAEKIPKLTLGRRVKEDATVSESGDGKETSPCEIGCFNRPNHP